MTKKVGIIGGSGLYAMEGLINIEELNVATPYGATSAPIVKGNLKGIDLDLHFIPRHGLGHVFSPSEVPYQANIWAMKKLGVDWIISVSAVGSLKEEIPPGDMILIDQFIDRTKTRPSTFFHNGIIAHTAFGDPICPVLRSFLLEATRECTDKVHDGGTYVCMEGPAFSTRAESSLYRSWGASVIGMTNIPEAKLAREAEISYATLAMSTDYDCWHDGHDDVTVDQVIAIMNSNVELARKVLQAVLPKIEAYNGEPPFAGSLPKSIITSPEKFPQKRRSELAPLLDKYFP